MNVSTKKIYPTILKPLFDRIGAIIFILIGAPILICTILILIIIEKCEIIFYQKRVRKNRKIFSILKFNIMHEDYKRGENEISKFGSLLRRLSLDDTTAFHSL